MNEFKWIVSDLDGTLIHHREEDGKNIIYPEVVNELHRAIKGKRFAIATGRHYKDALDITRKFNIKMPKNSFIIGTNGCQIYSIDSDELLLNKILDDDIVQNEVPKIISYLDEVAPNSTLVFAYGENETIYFVKNNSNKFEKMMKSVLTHEDNSDVFKYVVVNDVKELKNITKFCVDFADKMNNPLQFIDNLRKISSRMDYANTSESFIELIIKDINKATALDYINENHYHFKKEEILVLGDSGNDIEMMEYAGTSVTRDDARPEIISIATDVFEGGASIFVKNALISLIK